jgi:hypothetical protein
MTAPFLFGDEARWRRELLRLLRDGDIVKIHRLAWPAEASCRRVVRAHGLVRGR